jgi:hypothetical protein
MDDRTRYTLEGRWYELSNQCSARAERVGIAVNVWDDMSRACSALGRQVFWHGTDSPAFRKRDKV